MNHSRTESREHENAMMKMGARLKREVFTCHLIKKEFHISFLG